MKMDGVSLEELITDHNNTFYRRVQFKNIDNRIEIKRQFILNLSQNVLKFPLTR